jgi:hypothetical protein
MTGEHDGTGWLARGLLDDQALLSEVLTVARGDGDPADAFARAHAVLARRFGTDRVRDISDGEYRDAARELAGAGEPVAALAVTGIAAAGAELEAVRAEWEERYVARPQTWALRDALDLLASGRARRTDPDGVAGLDGAWYQKADFRLYSSAFRDPAVVVTTISGAVEVVTAFASEKARDGWLADRACGGTGPLVSALDGPPSRAAREEIALAGLLRNGRPAAEPPGRLRPETFTTYSRSEIYLAWRDAAPGSTVAEVAARLERRLLRAPDWGAVDVGERGQRTAPGYLQRIAATPVTEEQAGAALDALLSEDATLVASARPPAASTAIRPAPRAVSLISPPRPGPEPGPAPRM